MHQRRLILRDSTHETGPGGGVVHLDPDGTADPASRAELIARAGHWPLVEHEEDAHKRSLIWGAAPGLWMRYLEDRTTRTSALVFFGEDLFAVAEIVRRVITLFNLHPYTREELLTLPDETEGRERIRAIMRVALALGDTDDPELFAVLKAASRDFADAGARVAASWSTAYLDGEESLTLLADMARDDPDEAVRESAAGLLRAFEGG